MIVSMKVFWGATCPRRTGMLGGFSDDVQGPTPCRHHDHSRSFPKKSASAARSAIMTGGFPFATTDRDDVSTSSTRPPAILGGYPEFLCSFFTHNCQSFQQCRTGIDTPFHLLPYSSQNASLGHGRSPIFPFVYIPYFTHCHWEP